MRGEGQRDGHGRREAAPHEAEGAVEAARALAQHSCEGASGWQMKVANEGNDEGGNEGGNQVAIRRESTVRCRELGCRSTRR